MLFPRTLVTSDVLDILESLIIILTESNHQHFRQERGYYSLRIIKKIYMAIHKSEFLKNDWKKRLKNYQNKNDEMFRNIQNIFRKKQGLVFF